MPKVGKKLHTSKTGFEVYVVIVKDPASTRISYQFYSISPEGKMSDFITIKRSTLKKAKNALDCLMDWDAYLEVEDIDAIDDAVRKLLSTPADISKPDKATMQELKDAVVDYIIRNTKPMGKDAEVFIDGEHGYIKTTRFNDFVNQYSALGYNRKELLHRLNIMGVLVPLNTERYDILKKIDGKSERFYRFIIPEEV